MGKVIKTKQNKTDCIVFSWPDIPKDACCMAELIGMLPCAVLPRGFFSVSFIPFFPKDMKSTHF